MTGDHPQGDAAPDVPKTLAEKLEFLRDRMRREDGKKYTHDEIAQHLGRDRGYVAALCKGTRGNPTQEVLAGLADFFAVSPAFFFDDEASLRIVEQTDLARALAKKLKFLLDRVRLPDGKKYTYDQIAQHLGRDRGYVAGLWNGMQDPTQEVLAGLANFFDVSPAFFFDDARSKRIVEQMDLAQALADGGTRELALRMLSEVDPDDVDLVADMLRTIVDRRKKAAGDRPGDSD